MVITCGHCGVMVEARAVHAGNSLGRVIEWLQCPSCGDGSVKSASGVVYPPAPAGHTIRDLPEDIEQAWREARTAHAVAAYTASEMMCRKILMHLAVDVANAEPGKGFVDYVDDLDEAGHISTGLKPVFTRVKDRGNVANHELPASTEQDSLTTVAITEHLLRTIYELPGLLSST